MRRRKGFGAYICKLEGREVPVQRKHYAMPVLLRNRENPTILFVSEDTDNAWLGSAFAWSDTEQGHNFWFHISISHGEADYGLANEIFDSWREQLSA